VLPFLQQTNCLTNVLQGIFLILVLAGNYPLAKEELQALGTYGEGGVC